MSSRSGMPLNARPTSNASFADHQVPELVLEHDRHFLRICARMRGDIRTPSARVSKVMKK